MGTLETSPGVPRPSPERPEFWMSSTTLPTTSLSEPRPSSRTALSPLMPTHSDSGTSDVTMLSLTRKRLKRAIRLELRPRDQTILPPSSSTTLLTESSTQKLPINSTPEDSWLAFPLAQVNQAVATGTFSREESLNPTKRNSKERRSELPCICFPHICPLHSLYDHI